MAAVLLIIFKRLDTALQALASIRQAAPQRLYVAADGPRDPQEAQDVQAVRQAVIQAIDWPCEVKKRFSDTNQGCAQGVYNAICWFFTHESEGIIIEDDCVMSRSFFPFAQELLERYRDDSRVGMICGINYTQQVNLPASYTFSRYKSCWGWATWRRAWEQMDLAMRWRHTPYEASVLANAGYNQTYWRYRLRLIDCGAVSAWDWQWYLSMAAQNTLCIFPAVSLATNIGCGPGATHTVRKGAPGTNGLHGEISFPLVHPEEMAPYLPFEEAYRRTFDNLRNRIIQLLPITWKMRLKHLLNR